MKRLFLASALAVLAPVTASADEILETLDAARAAYEAGQMQQVLDELAYAQQLVREMKTAGLTDLLPPAPEGWDRKINTDMGTAMAMFGGGVGAEATYSRGQDSFTILLMADNAMVQGFAGMLGAAGMLVGKQQRIGAQTFIEQEGELTGLVDNRILVQASGAPLAVMQPILEQMDFDAMAGFGR
ncbi:hypothetical protein [Aliiruegeria lutimaris]|uniref:Uncharacterized protein n=1 Tax=Aliiruegeria lutimaris TaxID=571298 RepID=A0A1G9G6H8_9RHOB|nr:hypothetical protein [Aliiruegeria lutimaris]SDK96314.1 hypothetical protein SAMN04488026_106133 [Aliiruegeria lutimaris]